MSENAVFSNVSRRNFLKLSAVAAGGVWAGSALGCASNNEGSSGQTATDGDQICYCCCRPNCFNACMHKVHVREGKVVKSTLGEFEEPEFNRICLRGLSTPENIYHPDRVLYPMRRVEGTARGAGEWERITWDEAIAEVAGKIKQYQAEFGESSVMHNTVSGNVAIAASNFTSMFFNRINASTLQGRLDAGNSLGAGRVIGNPNAWPGNEQQDLVNAKTIFLWGNNLTDAQIHDWHFMADAIEAGANVICIDPTYTQMAAKASRWVPIRPASDTALEMSMMYVLLEEDLVDWDFMTNHTVAPFLVNDETGKFVRMSDMGVEPQIVKDEATGKETEVDPYVVWDLDADAPAELSTVKNPSLEGAYEVEGIACHTAFTLLKDEIMQYAPDYAETICDVPADTIRELARLACDGPVTHRVGWGMQSYDNGVHPHHAGATLAAMAGQYGQPGANYQYANWWLCLTTDPSITAVPNEVTSPSVQFQMMPAVFETGEYQGAPITPKMLYIHSSNLLCTFCDTNNLKAVFDKFEYVVTVDYMMTDTARYSDLVLPCAHFYEYEDVVNAGNHGHLVHSEKAIDPLGEAKFDGDILRLLSKELGLEDFLPEHEEMLKACVESEYHVSKGITLDALKERHAISYLDDPYLMWQDLNFLTPSTRVEFYVENPTAAAVYDKPADLEREHLPHFFEPREAWVQQGDEYPFVLMSERPRFRVHGQWAYNRILRELDPEPTVKMNPADAQEKGFADGDLVECFNGHGHAVAKVVFNEAVRRNTLVYPKSWQSDQHVAGCWSECLSWDVDPVAVNQSYFDCAVDVRKWEGAN